MIIGGVAHRHAAGRVVQIKGNLVAEDDCVKFVDLGKCRGSAGKKQRR